MTTKMVGMREFRGDMARISREARKKHQRLVVMNRNFPMFEVVPVMGDDEGTYKEEFVRKILEAEEQAKRGELISEKQLRKELGI